jgi:hypothetical protein
MNGIELEEQLPESYLKEGVKMGIEEKELRGCLKTPPHSQNKENRMEMERVVHTIKETALPKIKGGSSNLPKNLACLLLSIFAFHLTFVSFWYI